MKLHEFCDFLLEIKERDCKRTTIAHYRNVMKYICEYFGDRELESLTVFDMDEFLLHLSKCSIHSTSTGRKLSSVTQRNYANCLKHVISEAYRKDLIPKNVFLAATRPRNRKVKPKVITKSDLHDVLKISQQNESLMWMVMTHLFLNTGKRRGEILALDWTDINFKTNEISFCRSYNYDGSHAYFSTTKSEKESIVFISESLKRLLLDYYVFTKNIFSDREMPACLFYNSKTGRRLHPTSVTRHYGTLSKKNCIKNVYPHKFRHTVASILFESGVDAQTIAAQLDHSNASFTLKQYVHTFDPKLLSKNCEILQEEIEKSKS